MTNNNSKFIFLNLCLLCNGEIRYNNKINFKYNILLILVDELRYITNETLYLPNIQTMAENGVNFKYTFAQQALCEPSRISILTGRRPDSLRLYDSSRYQHKAVNKFTTMPKFFKKHGYNTYSVGKVFHTDNFFNDNDYRFSWSERPYYAPSNTFKNATMCDVPKANKIKKNLICPVVVSKQPNNTLPDLEILNEGIRILKRIKNIKPFFLALGFHRPHIPLKFPKKSLEKVPIEKIRPPVSPHIPKKMPLVAWHPWMDIRNHDDIKRLHILFPMGVMPGKWTLKIRQGYYAAALYIDDIIGILTTYVDKRNTIIVLTSDHGWSLGENGLWSKYSNFDVALRVPLLFNIPDMKPKSIDTPVELIDLFPTLTELVGLKKYIPRCKHNDKSKLCFDGKSLVPIMNTQFHEKLYAGHPFAFSQYPRPSVKPWGNTCKPSQKDIKIMGNSIRTDSYRYTEWVSFLRNWSIIYGYELYDHMDDPSEANNVYADEDYKKLVKRLSNLLRSYVERSIYSFNDL